MSVLDLLSELEHRSAVLDLVVEDEAERTLDIFIDAPLGAIDAELFDRLLAERDLLIAAIKGRRTGHAFAKCDECGRIAMVRASWKRFDEIANKPATDWPRCRMTPGCFGRHVPNQTELDAVVQ